MSFRTTERAPCRGFATTSAEDPLTGEQRGALSLRAQRIRAVVAGGLARTEVVQDLANDGARAVEGRFSFVLPEAASVSRFALGRGNGWLEARVIDSDSIASIPRGPVNRPVDGGSPTRDDVDSFVMRIVAFAPKQRRAVLLAYDGSLEEYADREVYRYPMSWSPCALAPLREFSIEVTLLGAPESFGKVATPNYPAEIRSLADRVIVALDRRTFVPHQDFTIEVERPRRDRVKVQVAVPAWKKPADHELFTRNGLVDPAASEATDAIGHVSIALDLPEVASTERSGAELPRARVIVLDKSYSQSASSLSYQRQLVERLLRLASANQRTRLLACDSACVEWPDGEAVVSAPRAVEAATWLGTLAPSGTFDLQGALVHAVALLEPGKRGQIVYLGDGRVSAGRLEKAVLVESAARLLAQEGVDLRIFGIGSRRDDALLFGLATAASATYAVLSDGVPIERTATEILRALRAPKLTDVKLEIPRGLRDPAPARWPALVMGQSLRVGARIAAPVLGTIRVRGKLEGNDYAATYSVAVTNDAEPNPLVANVWTRERLRESAESLTGWRFEFGASELSRSARVASRYTDWLLLESERAYAEYGLTKAPGVSGSAGSVVRRVSAAAGRPRGAFPERMPDGLVSPPTWIPDQREALPPLMPRSKVEAGRVTYRDGVESNPEHDARRQHEIRALTSRFHRCYERRVTRLDDWFEGSLGFGLRIGARGAFESLVAEGEAAPDLRELFSCLRSVAADSTYEPPLADTAELQFSADFAIDWNAGLRVSYPVSASEPWGRGAISAAIVAGDEQWRSAVPRTLRERRTRAVLDAPTPEQAILVALRGVEIEPSSVAALDLLAAVAGAHDELALVTAALEAELALSPKQPELRQRVARAWLLAGDERRACAHIRALGSGAPDLANANVLCRMRWLGEPAPRSSPSPSAAASQKILERGLDAQDPGPSCRPFTVRVLCDDSARCPTAVVLAPEGQIVSAFGHIPGKGRAAPLSFWPSTFGTYRVLLLGGEPLARGRVDVAVHVASGQFEFHRGGAVQTVASVELQPKRAGPGAIGIPFCGVSN